MVSVCFFSYILSLVAWRLLVIVVATDVLPPNFIIKDLVDRKLVSAADEMEQMNLGKCIDITVDVTSEPHCAVVGVRYKSILIKLLRMML